MKKNNVVRELLSDRDNRLSSKRLMGIICTLTLCATLGYTSFSGKEVTINTALVETVGLLAFGCLGLTSIDKFIAAKNSGITDSPPPTAPTDPFYQPPTQ